jgi:hypothetical protein
VNPTLNRSARALSCSVLAIALALPATAAALRSDASARTSLQLTLYSQDFGLVRERRTLEIPAGTHEVEFRDVADGIDPTSLEIHGIAGDPFQLLEQRLESDRISPQRLLELSVGGEVVLVTRTDGGEERTRARLLSTDGPVYEVDGEIWIRHPGEVVLPEMPAGLRARPALIWRLQAERGGRRTVEASYLTSGLGWSATYTGRLGPGGKALSMQGWVTLHNRSGIPFDGATVRLVAGDVRRIRRAVTASGMQMAMAEEMERAPRFRQEPTFEYHLYSLQDPLDLPEHSATQVLLREEDSIPVRRHLTFVGSPYAAHRPTGETRGLRPEIELELENPGDPLPGGSFRIYGEEAGAALFLGEDRIPHTPRGGALKLSVGRAFDVEADRVQTDFQAVAGGRYDREAAFRIEVRNHKATVVQVRLREPVPGDWKLLESSIPGTRIDSGTLGFELSVPSGGTAEVTYRVAIDQG